jgi:hypothetical protein
VSHSILANLRKGGFAYHNRAWWWFSQETWSFRQTCVSGESVPAFLIPKFRHELCLRGLICAHRSLIAEFSRLCPELRSRSHPGYNRTRVSLRVSENLGHIFSASYQRLRQAARTWRCHVSCARSPKKHGLETSRVCTPKMAVLPRKSDQSPNLFRFFLFVSFSANNYPLKKSFTPFPTISSWWSKISSATQRKFQFRVSAELNRHCQVNWSRELSPPVYGSWVLLSLSLSLSLSL